MEAHVKWRTIPHLPQCWVLTQYKDPFVAELIWALKYHQAKPVAKLFGECLAKHLITYQENTLVIPIPLSFSRHRERGYNQCAEIAKHLPYTMLEHGLVRKDSSEHQARLRKNERIKNVQGVFSVPHPNAIMKNRIIVLDDVITTGATLKEARRVLYEAGAQDVMCVAIAH
jgi:competence protein ComFC